MRTIPSGQYRNKFVWFGALCLALAACSTSTPSGAAYGECAWQWATQPLPELSAQVQEALNAAAIERVDASAEAYGENCLDAKTNEVQRFATMQTDFRFVLPVDDVADREAMGNLAGQVLAVLEGFPPESTPGPSSGQVGMRFEADGETLHLWFSFQQAMEARGQNPGGAALLEALEKP